MGLLPPKDRDGGDFASRRVAENEAEPIGGTGLLHDTDIGRTGLNLYRDAGGEAVAGDGSHADAVADNDEFFTGGEGAGPGEAAFRGAHIRGCGLVGAGVLGLRGSGRRGGEFRDRFGGGGRLFLLGGLFCGLFPGLFGERCLGFRVYGGRRRLDGGGGGSSHLGGVLAGEEVSGDGEAEGKKEDGAGGVSTFRRWL